MKKTLLLAAFAAIAFISCQKNETTIEDPTVVPGEETVGIPMKLVAEIPASKVTYTPDGNVLKTTWNATETISVVTLDGSDQIVAIDNFTSTGVDGRTKAEFTGTFNGGSTPDDVIVIYPALTEISGSKYATDPYVDSEATPRSALYGAEVGSMYIQGNFYPLKQTSDNDASHLVNYCVMSGKVNISDIKSNILTATLSNEMTVLKVTATFPDSAKGQTLTQMDIDAYDDTDTPASLARAKSWEYVNIPDNHIVGAGSIYDKYTTLYCNITIPASGVVTLYFVNFLYADQAIGNKWKFTAHVGAGTDTYVATKTFKAAASFDKGSIYRLSTTLSYIPGGALKGKFTINAGGDQVYFSKGNLQATTTDSGENWTWSFAEHQYDQPGGYTQYGCDNLKITSVGKSTATTCTVGLFGWSTDDNTYFGINTSTTSTEWDGSFVDWGTMAIEGSPANTWRTPTRAELNYLLNTRSASTVCGTANAHYARACVNLINGVILFPDEYTHPLATDVANINVANASASDNNIDADDWGKMEASGAVFLPIAGYVDPSYGEYVAVPGGSGAYWTSSPGGTVGNKAKLLIQSSDLGTNYSDLPYCRNSVRLVHDID